MSSRFAHIRTHNSSPGSTRVAPRRSSVRRAIVAFVVTGAFVVVPAAPVFAAGSASTTTTTTGASSTTSTTGLSTAAPNTSGAVWSGNPTAAGAGYDSLAAAMVSYWATQSGSDLNSFVKANSSQLGAAISPSSSASLSKLGQSGDLTKTNLNSSLANAGATLDINGLSSMSGLLTQLQAKSGTLDGQTVANGAAWATSLGAQYAPSLNTSMPTPDSLAAGLVYDSGLANLVSSQPNLFSQVNGSGLGTAAGQQAWANSLASASASLTPKMSSLPDPCMAGLMQSMATGTVSPNGGLGGLSCGACQVAGTYLHNQVTNIFTPGATSVLPSSAPGSVNGTDWSSLQGWLKGATQSQNPSLSGQLNTSFGGASMAGSCQGSSQATTGALSSTLPGVFANLGK